MNTLLNKRLAMYLEAEKVVMTGQSYTIGNRSLTRANLAEIRKAIDDLLAAGATIEGETMTGSRSKRVVFIG